MNKLYQLIDQLGNDSKYQEQGEQFLTLTNTTLDVVECVPQKSPLWAKDGKHGIHYSVTLKNARHSYTFDFWGSLHSREILESAKAENMAKRWKQITPSAYDVLTAIKPSMCTDFQEFCDMFGYDTDSIKSLKTWDAVRDQDVNVMRLFSHEELEALSLIN